MEQSSRPGRGPRPADSITRSICPYLSADGGAWRASAPIRDHACAAVVPSAPIALDKQRRLCLTADHPTCSTYLAARGDMEPGAEAGRVYPSAHASARSFVRTAPVVLDHGRIAFGIPSLRAERGVGQVALVAMMVLALGAILVARLPSGSDPGTVAASTSSPSASAPEMSEPPVVAATEAPGRTLVPTEVEPTPTTAPTGSAEPEASATAAPSPATYKVKSGDTLSGIATEFGTTWQELAELNGIDDPGRLRVGQVLQLP